MLKHCALSCQEGCSDVHSRCPVWSKLRECEENAAVMAEYCPASCGLCADQHSCRDLNEKKCPRWVDQGECDNNPAFMNKNCPKSCGLCHVNKAKHSELKRRQMLEAQPPPADAALLDWTATVGIRQSAVGANAKNTMNVIRATKIYWEHQQQQELNNGDAESHATHTVLDTCWNREPLCSFWAFLGECQQNEPYMTTYCAPACQSCEKTVPPKSGIEEEVKCPLHDEGNQVLRPGHLNKWLERIVSSTSSIKVLSRPSEAPATEVSIIEDKSLPPWVLQLKAFMTKEECIAMIRLGKSLGFESRTATTATSLSEIHKQQTRQRKSKSEDTYETAVCSIESGCRAQDIPDQLHNRLAGILQINVNYTASFRIHRYHSSQSLEEYKVNHDFVDTTITDGKNNGDSPRILSFLVYLSNAPHVGTSHRFPQLDITVQQPESGAALFWPNVFNADPVKPDPRMKYEMNINNGSQRKGSDGEHYVLHGAVHMHDILTPESNGCLTS